MPLWKHSPQNLGKSLLQPPVPACCPICCTVHAVSQLPIQVNHYRIKYEYFVVVVVVDRNPVGEGHSINTNTVQQIGQEVGLGQVAVKHCCQRSLGGGA